jgi:hypothetical protein
MYLTIKEKNPGSDIDYVTKIKDWIYILIKQVHIQ